MGGQRFGLGLGLLLQPAPIDLAGGGHGQRVGKDIGRGNHVMRQKFCKPAAKRLRVPPRRARHDDIGCQQIGFETVVPSGCHDGNVAHALAAPHGRLDLGEVDRLTPDLDARAFASMEIQFLIRADRAHVLGAIDAPARPRHILAESRRVHRRLAPITGADGGAGHDDAAHLLRRGLAAVGPLDSDRDAIGAAPDGQHAAAVIARGIDRVLGDDTRFRRRQMVHQQAVGRKMGGKQHNVLGRYRFTAQVDRPDALEPPSCFEPLGELAEYCRHRMQDGDLAIVEPAGETRQALLAHVVGRDGSAAEEAPEDIHVGCAEAQRIEQREAIVCADAELAAIAGNEMQQIAMRLADPLGTPRRARGIEDVGEIIRTWGNRREWPRRPRGFLDIHEPAAGRNNGPRALQVTAVGQQRDRFAVPQDMGDPVFRIGGIERHEGMACAKTPECCGQRMNPVLEEERHAAGLFLPAGQSCRNRRSERLKLPVANDAIAEFDGDLVSVIADGSLEGGRNRKRPTPWRRRRCSRIEFSCLVLMLGDLQRDSPHLYGRRATRRHAGSSFMQTSPSCRPYRPGGSRRRTPVAVIFVLKRHGIGMGQGRPGQALRMGQKSRTAAIGRRRRGQGGGSRRAMAPEAAAG